MAAAIAKTVNRVRITISAKHAKERRSAPLRSKRSTIESRSARGGAVTKEFAADANGGRCGIPLRQTFPKHVKRFTNELGRYPICCRYVSRDGRSQRAVVPAPPRGLQCRYRTAVQYQWPQPSKGARRPVR